MIIIQSVKTIEAYMDTVRIAISQRVPVPVFNSDGGSEIVYPEILTELIKGRRYVIPERGIDVMIGFTGEASTVLGISYEVMENYENSLRCLRNSNSSLLDRLNEIKKYGFWKRLKLLFTGYKT